MAAIGGAWLAAIFMGWIAESQGRRGAALISLLGFLAVSGGAVAFLMIEPVVRAKVMLSSPEAAGGYLMLAGPLPAALIGGGLVWLVFGPFVLMIGAEARPGAPRADRRKPATRREAAAAARREPEI